MDFFIAMKPPTATAQEKQVRIVNGKPIFYDPRSREGREETAHRSSHPS